MDLTKDALPTIRGEVSILRVVDKDGKPVNPESVIQYGDLTEVHRKEDGSLQLGPNMVVNLGRQVIARLLGGKEDNPSDWFVTKVSFGTGDVTPRYSDQTLSPQAVGGDPGGGNEVDLGSGLYKKAIDDVDFPGPFLVRFLFSLDYGEGNGFIVREAGLWTENLTMMARKTFPGIIKSEDVRVELAWTLRC